MYFFCVSFFLFIQHNTLMLMFMLIGEFFKVKLCFWLNCYIKHTHIHTQTYWQWNKCNYINIIHILCFMLSCKFHNRFFVLFNVLCYLFLSFTLQWTSSSGISYVEYCCCYALNFFTFWQPVFMLCFYVFIMGSAQKTLI